MNITPHNHADCPFTKVLKTIKSCGYNKIYPKPYQIRIPPATTQDLNYNWYTQRDLLFLDTHSEENRLTVSIPAHRMGRFCQIQKKQVGAWIEIDAAANEQNDQNKSE